MRALRKLVLGETWTLPLGVLATLAIALIADAVAGDSAWWRHAGGFLLLLLVLAVFTASLAPAWRRRYPSVGMRSSGSERPVDDEVRVPHG